MQWQKTIQNIYYVHNIIILILLIKQSHSKPHVNLSVRHKHTNRHNENAEKYFSL